MNEYPKCQACKAPRARCAYEIIVGYCKHKKKPEEEGSQGAELDAEAAKGKHAEQIKELMQHEQREDDQQAFDVLSDQQEQQSQPQGHDFDDDDSFSV